MEAPDDFYVELPSNSSTKLFPDNTHANYKVKLAVPLTLSEGYEVALVEAFFMRNWYNIMKDDGKISLSTIPKSGVPELTTNESLQLDEGYYIDPEELVYSLNRLFLSMPSLNSLELMRDNVRKAHDLENQLKNELTLFDQFLEKFKKSLDEMHKTYNFENAKFKQNLPSALTREKLRLMYADIVEKSNAYEQSLLEQKNKQESITKNAANITKLSNDLIQLEKDFNLTGEHLKELAYAKKRPFFEYLKNIKKVSVTIPGNTVISLSSVLMRMLGFDSDTLLNSSFNTAVLKGKHPTDLSSDVNSLCIYSNIVEHQYMGDSLVPLLRTVHIDDKDGICVTKTYPQSFYKPVSLRYIDVIEIDIRDMYGRKIHFSDGDVVVNKLHFRRKRPFLLQ